MKTMDNMAVFFDVIRFDSCEVRSTFHLDTILRITNTAHNTTIKPIYMSELIITKRSKNKLLLWGVVEIHDGPGSPTNNSAISQGLLCKAGPDLGFCSRRVPHVTEKFVTYFYRQDRHTLWHARTDSRWSVDKPEINKTIVIYVVGGCVSGLMHYLHTFRGFSRLVIILSKFSLLTNLWPVNKNEYDDDEQELE